MPTVRCRSPLRCRALAHRVGTAAHAACGSAAPSATAPVRPPAPPSPRPAPPTPDAALVAERARAHLRLEVADLVPSGAGTREDLRAALAAVDAASGWESGSSAAHPTGGYTRHRVTAVAGGGARVEFTDWASSPHRGDGPAMVDYDAHGAPVRATWMDQGLVHRVAGPADLSCDPRAPKFTYALSTSPWAWPATNLAHFDALLEAGCAQGEVSTWLQHGFAAGNGELSVELCAAGGEAAVMLEMARAGATPEAMAAVAARRAPSSWASPRR